MIAGRHRTAGIVGAQANFNNVVRVRPIRVMIMSLGNSGNLGHECKGGREISELKPSK